MCHVLFLEGEGVSMAAPCEWLWLPPWMVDVSCVVGGGGGEVVGGGGWGWVMTVPCRFTPLADCLLTHRH